MKELLEKAENNLKLNMIDNILGQISLARKPEDDLSMHVLDMFEVLKKGFTKQERIALVRNYNEIEKLFNPKNIIPDPLGGVKLRDSAMKTFHNKYSKILGDDLATAVGSKANDVVDAMYLASHKSIARKAKLAPVSLILKDRSTIKVLGQQNTFWIKSHYSRTLSWRVNNIGKEVVSLGLDTKSASAVFKERLGTQFKYTDAYWNIMASNVLNRSKNYSQVNFYTKSKVKTLEIVAVMDERTTPMCRDMDGRVFTVKTAVRVMEDALGATPEDFMDIQPWLGWDSKRKQSFYKRGGVKSFLPSGKTASDNAVFERRGIALPPFHGLCRTTTVFSEFEE